MPSPVVLQQQNHFAPKGDLIVSGIRRPAAAKACLRPTEPHSTNRYNYSYSGSSFSKKSDTSEASSGLNSAGPGPIWRTQPICRRQA